MDDEHSVVIFVVEPAPPGAELDVMSVDRVGKLLK